MSFNPHILPPEWYTLDTSTGLIQNKGGVFYRDGAIAVNTAGYFDTSQVAVGGLGRDWTGDFTAIVKVTGVNTIGANGTSSQPGIGIFAFEKPANYINSNVAFVSTNFESGLTYPSMKEYFFWKTSHGGTLNNSSAGSVSVPVWLKLVRSGNTLSGFQSNDGITYTQLGTNQTVVLGDPITVGFAGRWNSGTNIVGVGNAFLSNWSIA